MPSGIKYTLGDENYKMPSEMTCSVGDEIPGGITCTVGDNEMTCAMGNECPIR